MAEVVDVPRHRPLAFDKMESLIKEMQDPESGVPVGCQKSFLTVIPSAFMGYDLVQWIIDRFNLDESSNHVEAMSIANQLCQHGYFFPVNDSKNLILKDDSSLYRFQSPYYWPWQGSRTTGGPSAGPTLGPDNVEYAIYLVKRTLRNKQRHALEEYEMETLANLKKNLAAKWDFITMQAEEQVRLAKDRKKGEKIVSDSQERAYWRVVRPPPGLQSALDPCPVPARARPARPRRRTATHLHREVELLKSSLDRTRVKVSIALEALMAYTNTFAPYDPWINPPQPANPWVCDDILYWQINSPIVEVPSEKRVQRWAISLEELMADPTGLQEFTAFLRREYSHENIRFWLAVMDLRRGPQRLIQLKLNHIHQEFLRTGAQCEVNIDSATAELVAEGMRAGSRFALDHAAAHVYALLLKKDCYPRFIRSDHYRMLLANGKNHHHKKRFFGFGGGQVKKKSSSGGSAAVAAGGTGSGTLARRRGSDRSLSGSAHELAICAAQVQQRQPPAPPHSHSQSNLADIPFRDPNEEEPEALPWDGPSTVLSIARRRKDSAADSGSSSSELSGICGSSAGPTGVVAGSTVERRRLPQQSTLDGGLRGAAPPLRRLSAVEARHLPPLAPSPPRVAAPLPPAGAPPPPHPTPTISVSSAPEDDSPSAAPASCSTPDPPVFSAANTPTRDLNESPSVNVEQIAAIDDGLKRTRLKSHDSVSTDKFSKIESITYQRKDFSSCSDSAGVPGNYKDKTKVGSKIRISESVPSLENACNKNILPNVSIAQSVSIDSPKRDSSIQDREAKKDNMKAPGSSCQVTTSLEKETVIETMAQTVIGQSSCEPQVKGSECVVKNRPVRTSMAPLAVIEDIGADAESDAGAEASDDTEKLTSTNSEEVHEKSADTEKGAIVGSAEGTDMNLKKSAVGHVEHIEIVTLKGDSSINVQNNEARQSSNYEECKAKCTHLDVDKSAEAKFAEISVEQVERDPSMNTKKGVSTEESASFETATLTNIQQCTKAYIGTSVKANSEKCANVMQTEVADENLQNLTDVNNEKDPKENETERVVPYTEESADIHTEKSVDESSATDLKNEKTVPSASEAALEHDTKDKDDIAHKDDVSSEVQSVIVKSCNTSQSNVTAARNDVCPWDDERSGQSDAPFVKTYSTLGYL